MAVHSQAYVDHVTNGPFPGKPDPFAEAGRYFHPMHGEIIGQIIRQIRPRLVTMGYVSGRETSLQIAEKRQPDIYVKREADQPEPARKWDYARAAQGVLAEQGILTDELEPELDALYIKDIETSQLVTVVEIISPRNKNEQNLIWEYQERRTRLLRREVNVVEVDLIRSVKRLIDDPLAKLYPYHVAVHLHDQKSRLITMKLLEPLKRIAIPLRGEVIGVDLQAAYDEAYQQAMAAYHIHDEKDYAESTLPFLSTLSNEGRAVIMQAVDAWKQKLTELI